MKKCLSHKNTKSKLLPSFHQDHLRCLVPAHPVSMAYAKQRGKKCDVTIGSKQAEQGTTEIRLNHLGSAAAEMSLTDPT